MNGFHKHGGAYHHNKEYDRQRSTSSTVNVSPCSSNHRMNKSPKLIITKPPPENETWRRRTSPQEQNVIDNFSDMLDQFVTNLDDDDEESFEGLQSNKDKCPVETWRKKTSSQEQSAIDSFSLMLEEFSKDLCLTPPSDETGEQFFTKDTSSTTTTKTNNNNTTNTLHPDSNTLHPDSNTLHPDSAAGEKKAAYPTETWRRKTSVQEQSVIDSFSEMLEEFSADEGIVPYSDAVSVEYNYAPWMNVDSNVDSGNNTLVNSHADGDRTLLLYENDQQQKETEKKQMVHEEPTIVVEEYSELEEENPNLYQALLEDIDAHAEEFTSDLHQTHEMDSTKYFTKMAASGSNIHVCDDKSGYTVACSSHKGYEEKKRVSSGKKKNKWTFNKCSSNDNSQVTSVQHVANVSKSHNTRESKDIKQSRLTNACNQPRSHAVSHSCKENNNNFVVGSKQLRHSTGQLTRVGECKDKSTYILEVYRTNDNGKREMCKNNGVMDGTKKERHRLVYATVREVRHRGGVT